jgi:hypothetical protein
MPGKSDRFDRIITRNELTNTNCRKFSHPLSSIRSVGVSAGKIRNIHIVCWFVHGNKMRLLRVNQAPCKCKVNFQYTGLESKFHQYNRWFAMSVSKALAPRERASVNKNNNFVSSDYFRVVFRVGFRFRASIFDVVVVNNKPVAHLVNEDFGDNQGSDGYKIVLFLFLSPTVFVFVFSLCCCTLIDRLFVCSTSQRSRWRFRRVSICAKLFFLNRTSNQTSKRRIRQCVRVQWRRRHE